MPSKLNKLLILLLALPALFLPPLLGARLRGIPDGFWSYPPLVHKLPRHENFSSMVFLLFLLVLLMYLLIIARPAWFGFKRPGRPASGESTTAGRFPKRGWAGVVVGLSAWLMAWIPGPAPWSHYTFFPLWLGYILTMDGFVYMISGTSLWTRSRIQFAALFPASALSWWYFEYLNRFVENWWYESPIHHPTHYLLHASFCFSTVLPAVFETQDLLLCSKHFRSAFKRGPALKWAQSSEAMVTVLTLGVAGLYLAGAFPETFFFMLWLAPLFLLFPILVLAGTPNPCGRLSSGDWTRVAALSIAGLVCGWFWEMWNFWSYPKWHYQVPFVQGAALFEMPLAGYGGYLPFGVICWLFWLYFTNLARRP